MLPVTRNSTHTRRCWGCFSGVESVIYKLGQGIKDLGLWIVCKLSSASGAVIHGGVYGKSLEGRLARFDIQRLVEKRELVKSKVLSKEAQTLILRSYEGISQVVDTHLHIVGYGAKYHVNSKCEQGSSAIRTAVIHYASTGKYKGSAELAAARLVTYAKHFPRFHGKILPIHAAYRSDGTMDLSLTASALDNVHAEQTAHLARQNQISLVSAVSIHPHQKDWEEQLDNAHEKGIRLIKLYPTQGVDLASKGMIPFYEKVRQLGMTIIAHSGPQHAMKGHPEWEHYGHPERFKLPLQSGVNVILAHSGHQEHYEDFRLLCEQAAKEKWPGKVYGDLAAVLHYGPDFVKNLLKMTQLSSVTFLYGSDYPYTNLKGSDPYKLLWKAELLSKSDYEALKMVREYNPLLANFVALRSIRMMDKGQSIRFPISTFTY